MLMQDKGERGKRMSITRSELLERVAARQGLSIKEVDGAVKSILDGLIVALAQGKRIEVRGFGSFSLHYRKPRNGRNPKSGVTVELPGKHVVHFKPGKELRERVVFAMLNEIEKYGKEFVAGEGSRG
jgi:integration host factor subunit beta